MLEIKHKLHLDFPHITFPSQMQFSPLAIDNEDDTQDNTWQLNDEPDEVELEKFWTEVHADIAKESDWFSFAD